MSTFVVNGREYSVDQLTQQQRMLLDALVESENRLRVSERAAFLDRMAHEGTRAVFVQTMSAAEEAANVQAS